MDKASKFVIALLSIASAAVYLLIFNATPVFIETYAGFGAELPFQTKLLTNNYQALPFLAFLSLIPLCVFLNSKSLEKAQANMLHISVANISFSILFLVLSMWMLYSPIFSLS